MSDGLKIGCPTCAVKLRVRREAAGKRLRCPHCRSLMKIPELPPIEEEYGDDFGAYESFGAPPRRPRSPGRSRKKKKRKKQKWIIPTAIAGGVVLGVLFLAAMIFGLWRHFGVESLNVDEPLGYLTVDTELILVIRSADFRDNPATAEEIRKHDSSVMSKKSMRAIGIEPDDVILIAIGLKNAKDNGQFSALLQNGGMVLIQSRKKYDRAFLGIRSNKARHAGKEYLKDRKKLHGETPAMFFPNDYTIIVASEPTIKKLLANDDIAIGDSRFGFTDLKGSLVIAQTAKAGQFLPQENNLPAGADLVTEIPEMAKILSTDLRGLAISRQITNGNSAALRAVCSNPDEAARLAASIKNSPEKRRAVTAALTPVFLAQQPGVFAAGERNLNISIDGSTVRVSTRFP